jgi:hypothetical protein
VVQLWPAEPHCVLVLPPRQICPSQQPEQVLGQSLPPAPPPVPPVAHMPATHCSWGLHTAQVIAPEPHSALVFPRRQTPSPSQQPLQLLLRQRGEAPHAANQAAKTQQQKMARTDEGIFMATLRPLKPLCCPNEVHQSRPFIKCASPSSIST